MFQSHVMLTRLASYKHIQHNKFAFTRVNFVLLALTQQVINLLSNLNVRTLFVLIYYLLYVVFKFLSER